MIDSSREEFEKLPVIKNRIANFNLKYSGELNGYVGLKQYQSHVDFIDGCWFMFQQQQSQQANIDELQARIAIYEKHVKAIKHIHETQFDENTDTSFILGNLDGFIEYLESDLKGNKDEN